MIILDYKADVDHRYPEGMALHRVAVFAPPVENAIHEFVSANSKEEALGQARVWCLNNEHKSWVEVEV